MKYKKLFRHTLLIFVAMIAADVHATTINYTLKYLKWELISIPNPLPFSVNTPMKMFGEKIIEKLPLAEYGQNGDWVMYSYDSDSNLYKVAEKNTVFEPGKGYWAIQAASSDAIAVQVVTRYNIGATGPGGGIVFFVDQDSGGTSGLEAAPEDQGDGSEWCAIKTDVAGVNNITAVNTVDTNSGAQNTLLVAAACGETSAASVASTYVWPEGQTDGFLPNKDEQTLLFARRAIVGGLDKGYYWSSSEYGAGNAWNQDFTLGGQGAFDKLDSLGVRAVRAF